MPGFKMAKRSKFIVIALVLVAIVIGVRHYFSPGEVVKLETARGSKQLEILDVG